MAVKLNRKGYEHAKSLIESGRTSKDELGDWGEEQPDSERQNTYLERHGYQEYGLWFLGIHDEEPEDTKGHYGFPYGDFSRVHRSGLIAAESRAAQNDHPEIAKAARRLLDLIDGE
jgi:hypothetical protein